MGAGCPVCGWETERQKVMRDEDAVSPCEEAEELQAEAVRDYEQCKTKLQSLTTTIRHALGRREELGPDATLNMIGEILSGNATLI